MSRGPFALALRACGAPYGDTALAERLHDVAVHILPCIEGHVEQASPFAQASRYGSILPATWTLILALRARGLGTGLEDAPSPV